MALMGTKAVYETLEMGTYTVELDTVMATEKTSYNDPAVLEDKFTWTFLTPNEEDSKGRPFKLYVDTVRTWTGSDKNKLTGLMNALMGKPITGDDFEKIDLESLVGRAVKAIVVEKTSKTGRVYNQITALSPLRATSGGKRIAEPHESQLPAYVAAENQEAEAKSKAGAVRPEMGSTEGDGLGPDPQGRMPGEPGYDPFDVD